MGKHTDHLNKLREWKHFKESNYQSTMAMFSSQMAIVVGDVRVIR